MKYFLLLFRRVQIFFLKTELKSSTFFIGGYENKMVILNGRFLKDWAVELVNTLKTEGKIVFSHKQSISSLATGEIYTDNYYKLIK